MEGLAGSMAERLRSLVGKDGWDYCILWKISPDKGSIQWVGCCCAGADHGGSHQVSGEERVFPVLTPTTTGAPCRDAALHHPRSAACDSLAQLPTSIKLDSTSSIHAQTLITNQPRWTFLPTSPNSAPLDENSNATQLLVPVPDGVVELFIAKHVPEDDRVIQSVMSQYSNSVTFLNYESEEAPKPFLPCNNKSESHPWSMAPAPAAASSDQSNFAFSWDHPADPLRLSGSPLNLLSQHSCKDVYFDEGTAESILPRKVSLVPAGHAVDEALPPLVTQVVSEERDGCNDNNGSVKPEIIGRRAESGCSDGSNQGEDEDDGRTRGGGGKKHQSKNLVAERRRRKKLNDRLYVLRSLVPNISKMDRASILGDAIEFVKKLENQVKQLQEELERITPEEADEHRQLQVGGIEEDLDNTNNSSGQMEILISGGPNHRVGVEDCKKMMSGGYSSVTRTAAELPKQHPQKNQSSNADNGQHQMEIQVEVFQLNRNEFFVKVFCEHKIGGFLKLMEAINSLGLEVTNANVTTFNSLVLNVFKVEKRDSEVVEADQVRQSLIELTHRSTGEWTEPAGHKPEYEAEGYYHRHHYHGHSSNFLQSSSQHNLHFIQHHL